MAAALRYSLPRQICSATSATRAFSARMIPASSVLSRVPSLRSGLAKPPQLVKSAIIQEPFGAANRVATFHSTGRVAILPALPQHLEGTANDAAPIPESNPVHGSYHWTFERIVSAALIPVTIAPFVGASMYPVMDATLCALLVMHSHVGFQSSIIDYLPNKRVPKTRAALEWILRGATLAVAVGLYEFETNDVGLTEAIKRIWKA